MKLPDEHFHPQYQNLKQNQSKYYSKWISKSWNVPLLWCHFKRAVWIRSMLKMMKFQAQPRSCNIVVTILNIRSCSISTTKVSCGWNFFSQSSGSVTSPSNASYTNQSKANTLKTPVAASKTNVKSKRWKKTTLQKWRGNVSSSTSKNRGNCE